jgi:hypothetical protein
LRFAAHNISLLGVHVFAPSYVVWSRTSSLSLSLTAIERFGDLLKTSLHRTASFKSPTERAFLVVNIIKRLTAEYVCVYLCAGCDRFCMSTVTCVLDRRHRRGTHIHKSAHTHTHTHMFTLLMMHRGAAREKKWTKAEPVSAMGNQQPSEIIMQARKTWPQVYGDGGRGEIEKAVEMSRSLVSTVETNAENELGKQQKRKAPAGKNGTKQPQKRSKTSPTSREQTKSKKP